MPLGEIKLGHVRSYDLGIGLDRLSGTPLNLAVQVPSVVVSPRTRGARQGFEVTRITSSHDLQSKMGVDAEASYGCASFGAGVSARFSYAESQDVHSSTLFIAIIATIALADMSIPECVLMPQAAAVVDRPDVFAARYGNMFGRSGTRGGVFVGMLQVMTFDERVASELSGKLNGTYGLFSAEVSTSFSTAVHDANAEVYFSIHSEGGPAIQIKDPRDPVELLQHANEWISALYSSPDEMSVPYEWSFAPLTMAEGGPDPLNAVDVENAQDVLAFCARERLTLRDTLNQLSWFRMHADKYDWTSSPPMESFVAAIRAKQDDLELLKGCASAAMNHPGAAAYPNEFAATKGRVYPTDVLDPTPLPVALPGQPPVPTIDPPSVEHHWSVRDMVNANTSVRPIDPTGVIVPPVQ